jgi:hypothetical protein
MQCEDLDLTQLPQDGIHWPALVNKEHSSTTEGSEFLDQKNKYR